MPTLLNTHKEMNSEKLSNLESRAIFSLSAILGLRMLGLFMVIPLFSLYANQLKGATPTLIGIAIGIYGLAQAVCQIPFGTLSDRIGRKPIILVGLVIFVLGSVLAGLAHTINMMILGRLLQGVGAIGSTILALIADLTRESQRTKAMAISGVTIGLSFSLAMICGPVLTKWFPVNQLFLIAAILGATGILLLYFLVPEESCSTCQPKSLPRQSILLLMQSTTLMPLNLGIFFLHAIFTASFIVIPISLFRFNGLAAKEQWSIYLPTLLFAFCLSLVAIQRAEKHRQIRPYFLGSIILLSLGVLILWLAPTHFGWVSFGLSCFFAGFSILEAFMPSLISRVAPKGHKGSALGIYSCAQFLGIFFGGALGGWLYGRYQFFGVYSFILSITLVWFFLASLVQPFEIEARYVH